MVYDLQKAGMWKRIAAWMLDSILVVVLATGAACLLSFLLGYDGYTQQVEDAYASYGAEYGVHFEITQEEYEAMTVEERQSYDAAYDALISDRDAMRAYNMMMNLMLVITTMSILVAILGIEFIVPLILGNGQTVGKKVFTLGLVRTDGVRLNTMQLFARTFLGKFAIETMIPVYILLMLFWGNGGGLGLLVLAALGIAQVVILIASRTNAVLHDLMAGTAVVDISSQMIFQTTEDLIAYKKKIAAEQAKRQKY